jgi:hypothetical protein
MTLLQAHTTVTDPHGDRAYADEQFVPIVGDVLGKTLPASKTVDESRTSIILVDDADLTSPVVTGGRYAIEAFLIVDGDPDAGMSLTLTAPGGSSGAWAPVAPATTVGGVGESNLARHAFGALATVAVTSGGVIIPPRGALATGSVPGSVTLQWAQATTGVSPLFLRAGSWLRLTRTG